MNQSEISTPEVEELFSVTNKTTPIKSRAQFRQRLPNLVGPKNQELQFDERPWWTPTQEWKEGVANLTQGYTQNTGESISIKLQDEREKWELLARVCEDSRKNEEGFRHRILWKYLEERMVAKSAYMILLEKTRKLKNKYSSMKLVAKAAAKNVKIFNPFWDIEKEIQEIEDDYVSIPDIFEEGLLDFEGESEEF